MDIAINVKIAEATVVHGRINRLLTGAVAVLVMLALKRHYSQAGAEALIWILAPTARLTGWMTGASPVWEAGVGFADYGRGIIIAPACAGVNFMIMAFGLAAFCGLGRLRRLTVMIAWLVFSCIAAYLIALSVNTIRIILSMMLYQSDIYSDWIAPQDLHRLVGVWIYLGALGLFFKGLQPIMNRFADRFDQKCRLGCAMQSSWLPLGWYLSGAVGVPVANLVFKAPLPAFGRHCLAVAAAALVMWGGGYLVRLIIARNSATGIR